MNRSALVAVATTAFLQCTTLPGQEWYREDRSAPPPARRFHGLGFDPERAVTVLFGGTDDGIRPDHNDGAYALLTGLAANASMESGAPVVVEKLLHG